MSIQLPADLSIEAVLLGDTFNEDPAINMKKVRLALKYLQKYLESKVKTFDTSGLSDWNDKDLKQKFTSHMYHTFIEWCRQLGVDLNSLDSEQWHEVVEVLSDDVNDYWGMGARLTSQYPGSPMELDYE